MLMGGGAIVTVCHAIAQSEAARSRRPVWLVGPSREVRQAACFSIRGHLTAFPDVSFQLPPGNYNRVRKAEFQAAFEEHKGAVYAFAWRMTGSPAVAEDVLQEVFLVLLDQPDRFNPNRGGLRPFLMGIARNRVLKRWREDHRWVGLEEEAYRAEPVDPARGDVAIVVGEAVRALPPLQREALILAEYEGLSLEEIARVVGSEVGTVKSRLHRARTNLRRALAPLRSVNGVRSHGTTG
jgi:RNA polymerase sigma-70 factor (ECF subfamily)